MYFKLGKCIKHEQRSEKLGATCGRISHMNTCDRSSFGKRLCDRHVRWEDFNCFGSPYKYFTLSNNFPCKCVRHVTRSLTSFNMLGPAVPFGWSKDKEDRQRGKEWRRGRLSGEEATLPLSDALELRELPQDFSLFSVDEGLQSATVHSHLKQRE